MGMPAAWVIGVMSIILQAWMSSSGLAIQRQARVAKNNEPNKSKHKKYDNKIMLGVIIYVASLPLNFLAVTTAPISVIGALSACVYIINSAFLSWRSGEVFHKTDIFAMACGLVGCIGIVACAPRPESLGPKELNDSLKLLEFWKHAGVFLLIIAVVIGLGISLRLIRESRRPPRGDQSPTVEEKARRPAVAVAYAVVSATFAVGAECLMKSLGIFAFQGWNYVMEPVHFIQFISALVCLGMVGLCSLVSVTMGAQRYDSRFFLPSFLACCNLLSALYGLSIGEFADASVFKTIMFGVFCVIALLAILLGSLHTNSDIPEIVKNVSRDFGLSSSKLEEGDSSSRPSLGSSAFREMRVPGRRSETISETTTLTGQGSRVNSPSKRIVPAGYGSNDNFQSRTQ